MRIEKLKIIGEMCICIYLILIGILILIGAVIIANNFNLSWFPPFILFIHFGIILFYVLLNTIEKK